MAFFLDSLLAQGGRQLGTIDRARQEHLITIIRHCILTKDFYFLRLIHLLDAFAKTSECCKILSVGCGQGYQESFLAGRLPEVQVEATDWKIIAPFSAGFANLHYSEQNILEWSEERDYDFVFSIEALEHIKDYSLAFKNLARKVKPGGYLYLSVPFATSAEQHDEALARREWDNHEHYRPGFSFEDLDELFHANGFAVRHCGNMFRLGVANVVNRLLDKIDPSQLDHTLSEFGQLFLFDIVEQRARNRDEAVGIRYLGQKI